MSSPLRGQSDPSTSDEPVLGPKNAAERFGLRATFGVVAVVVGAIPFLVFWLLMRGNWGPLARTDAETAAILNDAANDSPMLAGTMRAISGLADTSAIVLVLVLATLFLLIREQRRLAAFVAVTGLALPVLINVTKALIDRARPIVESPVVATPSNASFPSGHAASAITAYGVLLLITLPSAQEKFRSWLVAAWVVIFVAIGFSRLALGVHFVSDVVAGWALGAALLAVTTAAFRGWQHDRGKFAHESLDPLDIPHQDAVHAQPSTEPQFDAGTVKRLLGAALLTWGALTALGLIVTGPLMSTWLGRLDESVALGFVRLRTPTLTDLAEAIGLLAGTRAVIVVGLTAAVLGIAFIKRWRPAAFVAAAILGELLLYAAISQVVNRERPNVIDLTTGLPAGASWPSGHSAAAAAIYGSTAALIMLHHEQRWRWLALAVPIIVVPAVAISRIYMAAHYPTDVVAGILLGSAWVLICVRLILTRNTQEKAS